METVMEKLTNAETVVEKLPTEETGMEKLPNEMLDSILKWLPHKDRFSCFNVCRRMRIVLNESTGVVLHIGKGIDEIWEEFPGRFQKLSAISQYGVCTAFFSEISEDTKDLHKFKNPTILKELWLDGIIPANVFNAFSPELKQLQKLTLHVTTLSVISADEFLLDFPNLNTFRISTASGEEIEYENLTLVADNVVHLMRHGHVYPSLKNLNLQIPFIPERATDVTEAVVNFIVRQKRSLKQVAVSVEGSGDVEVRANRAPVQLTTADHEGINLTSCIVQCGLADHNSMRNLRSIVTHQTQARSLFCTTGYVPLSKFRRSIKACALTLTTIQLAIGGETDASGVNLHLFAPCKNLRVLALVGPEKEDDTEDPFEEDEDDIEPQLLNADLHSVGSLPDNLQVLKIFNLFMTSADVGIAIRLPKLRVLRFDNIGRFGNLGLTLPDAFETLGKKTLRAIEWKQCMNVKSVHEARRGNDPNAFFCALLIRHVGDEGFRAYLNDIRRVYDYRNSENKEPEILPWDNRDFVLKKNCFSMTELEDGDLSDEEDSSDDEEEEDGEGLNDSEEEDEIVVEEEDEDVEIDDQELDEAFAELDEEEDDDDEENAEDEPGLLPHDLMEGGALLDIDEEGMDDGDDADDMDIDEDEADDDDAEFMEEDDGDDY